MLLFIIFEESSKTIPAANPDPIFKLMELLNKVILLEFCIYIPPIPSIPLFSSIIVLLIYTLNECSICIAPIFRNAILFII